MTELQEISEFYDKRVHSKEKEIQNLRNYISQLENSDNRLNDEYEQQLNEKDREIKKLLRLVKSDDQKGKKDEIAEVYSKQLSSKKSEIEKLRRNISELRTLEKGLVPSEELADRNVKIKKLLDILKLKEDENKKLSEQLDDKIIAERDYAGKIKSALTKKGRSDRVMFERLTNDIHEKKQETERLRTYTLSQDRIVRQLDNQVLEYKKHIDQLEIFLQEKDSVRDKLERNFSQQLKNKDYEIQQLAEDLKKQAGRKDLSLQDELVKLKTMLQTKESELDGLSKSFASVKEQNRIFSKRLEERQKLFVESENTYNKIVQSLREQHENRIRDVLHKSTRREIQLRAELDKLKVSQSEKEIAIADKQKDIDETLLQFAETSKKLLAIKDTEGYTDADVTAAQLKEKEAYLKKKEIELTELLTEATEKVTEANKKESEIAKREEMLLQEQVALNSELSVLKSAGIQIGQDRKFLKEKIQDYSAPKAIEQPTPIPEAVEQPEQPEQPEVLPEVVEQPEFPEIAEQVEAPAPEPVTEQKEKDDVLGILRKPSANVEIEKPAVKGKEKGFKQSRSRSRILPKPPSRLIKAKVNRPKLKEALIKQAEREDAFPERGGYGELDEIKSIINIGLQHGDTIEQIKSSLNSSGYSKKNIDKAFQEAKD